MADKKIETSLIGSHFTSFDAPENNLKVVELLFVRVRVQVRVQVVCVCWHVPCVLERANFVSVDEWERLRDQSRMWV